MTLLSEQVYGHGAASFPYGSYDEGSGGYYLWYYVLRWIYVLLLLTYKQNPKMI
jgi:hypothetical protein